MPRWCALLVALALLVSAVVLTAMGVGWIQGDELIATVACLLVLGLVAIAIIVLSIAYRFRTTLANDDWIYW